MKHTQAKATDEECVQLDAPVGEEKSELNSFDLRIRAAIEDPETPEDCRELFEWLEECRAKRRQAKRDAAQGMPPDAA